MTHFSSSHDAQLDSWFVVWTESRAEKKVEARIAALGLSPWLPTVKERHRWSDRWREVECPLFPGYLFAGTNADWHQILRAPGVLTVVREGVKPALLADSFVTSVRDAIEREGTAPEAVTESVDYAPGDEVIVQEGVLRRVRGIVRERRSRRQLVRGSDAIAHAVVPLAVHVRLPRCRRLQCRVQLLGTADHSPQHHQLRGTNHFGEVRR